MYQVSKKKSLRENPFVPIYRTCNNGSNEEKYKLIKTKELEVPRYIDVELTNNCNFKCRFCPTGTKSMKRTRGFMSDEVAESISKNVEKYKIPGVRFIRWGEPTIHPKYIEIMSRVKKAGALIHINTNGSKLDEEQIKSLLKIPLDSIKISFQGVDSESYNEMRFGGNYEELLKKVKLFSQIRDKFTPPPHVIFRFQQQ